MLTIRYSEFSSILGPSSCFFFFFQQGTDMLYCCFRYLFSRKANQSYFRLFRPLKDQNTIVACKYKYLVSFGTWRDENDRGHSFDQQHRTLYTTVK